LIKHWG